MKKIIAKWVKFVASPMGLWTFFEVISTFIAVFLAPPRNKIAITVAVFFCVLAILPIISKKEIGNFAAYRYLPGVNLYYIGEKESVKYASIKEFHRSLIKDSKTVLSELEKGKYIALTHDMVINRIKKDPSIVLQTAKKLYSDNLSRIYKNAIGEENRDTGTSYPQSSTDVRSFYFVFFHKNTN